MRYHTILVTQRELERTIQFFNDNKNDAINAAETWLVKNGAKGDYFEINVMEENIEKIFYEKVVGKL